MKNDEDDFDNGMTLTLMTMFLQSGCSPEASAIACRLCWDSLVNMCPKKEFINEELNEMKKSIDYILENSVLKHKKDDE